MGISGSDLTEVPTIYKANFLGLCNLHLLDPGIPIGQDFLDNHPSTFWEVLLTY